MSTEKMHEKRLSLVHPYPGYEDNRFAQDIISTGGWPEWATHVAFYHGDWYVTGECGRYAIFTNYCLHTGWFTNLLTKQQFVDITNTNSIAFLGETTCSKRCRLVSCRDKT